jgi:uncharacterized protein (TIRG00374 family)
MTMSGTDPLPAPRGRVPAGTARRWRDRAVLVGLLALVLAGMAALAAATGWREVLAQIGRLGPAQVAALLGLSLVNYGFRGLRWHLFARRLGLPTGILRNFTHFLGGFAMSVTPGRVGELVRMRWLRRETGWPVERTAPLVLVDRASDLAAMAVLMAAGLAASTGGLSGAVPVAILALALAWIATRPRLLAGIAGLGYRLTGRFARLFARLRGAARSLAQFSSPGVLLAAGVLGVVGWAAEGYAFWLLLQFMSADLPLARAVVIFTFATLAGGLTGAPGGVGGAEAAMVALLALDGVGLEISVPATAVIRLTTLWFALAVGLVAFPLAERIPKTDKTR